ncbi:PREDICTED: tripartite motif-containing protein 43-like [Odobenus rosmarus divergens]|uniref:Tripartite motif-containing protein 43-like n=1 Tax=Odobenus rosmarus divergens TaxID=9708 RepID=A0A2U3X5P3_ODORO|nr:PREDICTED: tripartite motif-containing protein 43-like [Odobenus rosmarus divergens]
MASRNLDLALPEPVQKEFICPVCLNTFTDPVTICCGHSFCRSCLYLFWEVAEIPYQCLVCCEPSQRREYKTNSVLKNLVYIARKANLREFLHSEEQMCGTHKKTKMIFCREEESLLCWLCSDSPEHKAHRHCSTEEAIEEQREKLSDEMRSLWKKIQGIQESLNKYGRMTVPSMYFVTQHENVIPAHETPCPVLREESETLESLREEGNEMCDQFRRNQSHLINCMSYLREMYMELVAMCQKPDGELLQELGDTLARIFLLTVNVTFSRVITNHDTRLFEDVRSLRYDRDHLYASLIPGTSDYFASWGEPCFSSGKHYWELEVNDSWDWVVGVCEGFRDNSWMRNIGPLEELSGTFLLMCVKEDDGYRLWATCPLSPVFTEKPQGKVGVFLDFDTGSLSFVDVAKHWVIWRYHDGCLKSPVRPFMCSGHR